MDGHLCAFAAPQRTRAHGLSILCEEEKTAKSTSSVDRSESHVGARLAGINAGQARQPRVAVMAATRGDRTRHWGDDGEGHKSAYLVMTDRVSRSMRPSGVRSSHTSSAPVRAHSYCQGTMFAWCSARRHDAAPGYAHGLAS